jgi:hypothetical protein
MKTGLWIVILDTVFWSLVMFLICVALSWPMWLVGSMAGISFLVSLFVMGLATAAGNADRLSGKQ